MTESKCTYVEELIPDLLLDRAGIVTRRKAERHIAEGCNDCRAALREQLKALAAVGYVQSAPAPESLKTRLMQRVRAEKPQAFVEPKPGLLVAYSAHIPWQESGLPGVRHKFLHREKETGFVTSLVQMDAGVRYPAHRHAGMERLFMLRGTLEFAGFRARAGDLCLANANTEHGIVHAVEDSEFLVIASEADELILAP